MLSYIAKRIWLMIPTVIAILVISFLLMQSAPGDTVQRQLGLDGDNTYVSLQVYQKSYYAKATELGVLSPDFYFTLAPSYFPDNINKVYPIQIRKSRKAILRETHDWPTLSHLYKAINQTIILLEKEGTETDLLKNLLLLESSNSLAALKRYAQQLTPQSSPTTTIASSIEDITNTIGVLSVNRSLSLPSLRWHGSDNQFHHWVSRGLMSADHISLVDGRPVWEKIGTALKWTFSISLISLILIGLLSLGLAYSQVLSPDSWWDRVSSTVLYSLYTMPLFWFCTLMVVFFTTSEYGTWTDIFPSVGIRPSFGADTFLFKLSQNAGQLILPIFCLVLHSMAYLTRQVKRDMMAGLRKNYTLTARAKGLSERQVLRQHILPDALLPFTTLMTGAIPALFTGSVIVEVIFNIPGIGRLMLESVNNADWPVTLSILVIISIATIVGYLIGDIILVRLYPKATQSVINTHSVG